MADRVMFVQLKTGHDTDKGPAWISWVRFTRTWQTAYLLTRRAAAGSRARLSRNRFALGEAASTPASGV